MLAFLRLLSRGADGGICCGSNCGIEVLREINIRCSTIGAGPWVENSRSLISKDRLSTRAGMGCSVASCIDRYCRKVHSSKGINLSCLNPNF